MSLARHFFREFRPFFRMFQEPLARSPSYSFPSHPLFEDPFFQVLTTAHPAVDIAEEGNKYVVHADVPGVKKENLTVRIEDGGRSLTIEGKVAVQRPETASGGAPGTVVQGEQPSNQISSERSFTGSSTFSRTVWLPQPVDGNNVAAKLQDGILTLTIPKAEDKASIKVAVE